jgi:hypothetical protein
MKSYLMSISEIGDLLGVSHQRADQLSRLPHFPRPEATLSTGRVWNREAVVTWLLMTGRLSEHPDD